MPIDWSFFLSVWHSVNSLLVSVADWTLSGHQYNDSVSNKNLALHRRQNNCPGITLIFLVFSCWAIWRVITRSFLKLRQCFINTPQHLLSLLSKILRNTCSQCSIWSFLSPSYSKVLLSTNTCLPHLFQSHLQFLVNCCKLLSIFKILSKSHITDIFLISSVFCKCSYKLWFFFSKILNSPNLYINWSNMWYPDYQNKNFNLCRLLQANENIICKDQVTIQNMY